MRVSKWQNELKHLSIPKKDSKDIDKEVDTLDEEMYNEIKQEKTQSKGKKIFHLILLYFLGLFGFIGYIVIFDKPKYAIYLIHLVAIPIIIFIVIQLVDCIKNIFKEGKSIEKYALWALVILLIPFLGALLYWFMKKDW